MTNIRRLFLSACAATLLSLSAFTPTYADEPLRRITVEGNSAASHLAGKVGVYNATLWEESKVPTMVVVTGQNCAQCDQLKASLEKLAAEYPEYRFMKGDPKTAVVDAKDLPMLAIRIPSPGKKEHVSIIPVYSADSSPEYLAALMQSRIIAAEVEDSLYDEFIKARQNYRLKLKPYEELVNRVEAMADLATAEEVARMQEAEPRNYQAAHEAYKLKRKRYEDLINEIDSVAATETLEELATKDLSNRKWREAQERFQADLVPLSGQK